MISTRELQWLSQLIEKTGVDIAEDYASQFSKTLENLGLFSEFAGTGPVPLEVWIGIAQALADASGYKVPPDFGFHLP
jgi:hypothetical protein